MTHGHLLRTIARHWLEDQNTAREISKILRPKEKELKVRRSSIRPKNRRRLRQFDERRSMEALMTLPMRTLRRIGKIERPSCSDAVKVRHALVLAIAQHAPVRIRSLAELEIGENILDYGKGLRRQVRIYLPEDKTKNARPYEAPLPKHIYPLLDAWLTTYRPRLCPHPSSYLFPNSKGALMHGDGLGRSACSFLEQDSGIKMNMHLFRHLTAKVILEHDPNAMEVVRQILGHSSTRTTERAYAELKTDPAFAKLDATYKALAGDPKRKGRPFRPTRGGKSAAPARTSQ